MSNRKCIVCCNEVRDADGCEDCYPIKAMEVDTLDCEVDCLGCEDDCFEGACPFHN